MARTKPQQVKMWYNNGHATTSGEGEKGHDAG